MPGYLPTAIPTPRQLEYQDWEMGLFLHFGIRTFYEGHLDWDGKPMPAEGFTPSQFDANNWVEAVKEAGMQYAVFVCKHHDGFANWPSKFSNYTVAQTPWKEGKGDVVAEFVTSCRKNDIKIGFYYSPAEWGSPVYEDENAYDDHFINQVSELLGNYGEIDMLWFDGCGSGDHVYDWKRIVGEIRRLQPNILVFSMGDPDYRWVGNEMGMADLPNWNTVSFSSDIQVVDNADEVRWLPAECDCMMRWGNWFYSDSDVHTVKSLDVLMGLYYLSVGRGANLLLNIGPDRRGLLPDGDHARLLEFGAEVKRRFSQPFACMNDGEVTETGWQYVPPKPFNIDHVVIQEDLTEGEAIRSFEIKIRPWYGEEMITVYKGENIGHKAICRIPPVVAFKVAVEITNSDRPAKLRNVELFKTY